MSKKNILIWLFLSHCALHTSAAYGEDLWDRIEVHGFASQGFLKSDGNNVFDGTEDGSFQFNEFGINVSSDLNERLRAGLQLFSRDLGDIGNNEVSLDWAYGDYRWRDWLGIRAGKIKIPYGFYNETRDIDMLRTSIFLPPSLYYEGNRDMQSALFGAGIYGNIYSSLLGEFSYQLQVGESDVSSDSSALKYRQDQEDTSLAELEISRQYTLDFEWETPLEGLRLGGFLLRTDATIEFDEASDTTETSDEETEISGDESEPPDGAPTAPDEDQSRTFYIISAEYTWENLLLAAEYLHPERSHDSQGYYLSASYRFTDWFELGGYYSVYYAHADDKDGDGDGSQRQERPDYYAWQKELVLTTRFDINEHWNVKLEGHLIDGVAQLLEQDNPEGLQEHSSLLAIKTSYNF